MKIIFILSIVAFSSAQELNKFYSVEKLIEEFRVSIINLDSEKKFLNLFLHDSITWAMVHDGKTASEKKVTRPSFNFFSSDVRSFYKLLKSQKVDLEERFYDVQIQKFSLFATVQFKYSFHRGEEILNWGDEYWSLIKVNNQWKISSVTWTENLEKYEKCPFLNKKYFTYSGVR